MSPEAIRAMFSVETDKTLITLITLKSSASSGLATNIRLADNYTQRLSETEADILYGVVSNGLEYVFLPLEISFPTEDNSSAPRCTITINDVTHILMPQLRALSGSIAVDMALVLSSSPDVEEIMYTGFNLTNIRYNKSTITAELTIPSLEVEPFPVHSFTPSYFPGLF